MNTSDPRHGTPAGARQHARNKETPCEPCRIARNADRAASRAKYVTDELALTNGEWRPVRGVLRWVPNLPPPITSRPTFKVHDLIACPTCHARVDETCKSAGGNSRTPHVNRLAGRMCPCGASLGPKKTMCEPCRMDARQETFARRELRQPTAIRRRQDVAA